MDFSVGLVAWDMAGTARPRPFGDSDTNITVEYHLHSMADVQALRQQLRGYNNQATPAVVPVMWLSDPSFDGYYRIRSAACDNDQGMYLSHRVVVQYELERLRGAPIVEQTFSGGPRSFVTTGVAAVAPWLSLPGGWAGESASVGNTGFSNFRQVTTDLAVRTTTSTVSGSVSYAERMTSIVPPDQFYNGAVLFRAGAALAPQTGRLPVDPAAPWELDNGLIKITSKPSNAAMFGVWNRNVAGSAWSTRDKSLTVYEFIPPTDDDWGAGSYTIVDPASIVALKVSPEETIISARYPYSPLTGSQVGSVDVRIGLRRGARVAHFSVSASSPAYYGLRYVTGFTGAGVGVSHGMGAPAYGLVETADDVNGMRSLLFQGSYGVNLSTGRARLTTPGLTLDMGVGSRVTSLYAEETPGHLLAEYLAAQTERARVVGR